MAWLRTTDVDDVDTDVDRSIGISDVDNEQKKAAVLAIPNLFGIRDQCSYENLMPDDLRWS